MSSRDEAAAADGAGGDRDAESAASETTALTTSPGDDFALALCPTCPAGASVEDSLDGLREAGHCACATSQSGEKDDNERFRQWTCAPHATVWGKREQGAAGGSACRVDHGGVGFCTEACPSGCGLGSS